MPILFPESDAGDSLATLRDRLDQVDAGLHRLLRERFDIVARIAEAKGPQESVIRPAREAAVIENRLAGHSGGMPREVLVHLWRVLIGAACLVQRPYRVHVAGPIEAARFLYGPVPVTRCADARAAVAALAEAPGDLALVDVAAQDGWWHGRGGAHAIARVDLSDGGGAVILGGPAVAPGTGPRALIVRGEVAPREVAASDIRADDDVVGRYHPFPLAVPVAQ